MRLQMRLPTNCLHSYYTAIFKFFNWIFEGYPVFCSNHFSRVGWVEGRSPHTSHPPIACPKPIINPPRPSAPTPPPFAQFVVQTLPAFSRRSKRSRASPRAGRLQSPPNPFPITSLLSAGADRLCDPVEGMRRVSGRAWIGMRLWETALKPSPDCNRPSGGTCVGWHT
jgi:hypothetical protein